MTGWEAGLCCGVIGIPPTMSIHSKEAYEEVARNDFPFIIVMQYHQIDKKFWEKYCIAHRERNWLLISVYS